MSNPQTILPHSPKQLSDTSSDLDEKHPADNLDLESKKETVVQDRPAILYNEDGEVIIQDTEGAVGLPWSKKGPALALVLLFVLGSNFAGSAISPLKSTIKKEMGINNARYGALATADSLINTILPILTGIAIDYYGAAQGALVASIFILVGEVLSAVGATVNSYGLLLVGQIIFGFGSTAIETSQSKLYTHYFRGNNVGGFGWLAAVYGLDVGIGRVYNLAGKLSAVPVVEASGNWVWGFWLPVIMCALSLAIVVVYWFFEKSLPEKNRPSTGRKVARAAEAAGVVQTRSTVVARLQYVYMSIMAVPAAFWLMTISQLLQAGAVLTYTSNLADVIAVTRNATKETAGYTSAIGQVIPIVLTPILGLGFDLFGRRTQIIAFTAALWVLVFSLLGFTTVHALVPTILGSVALALNSLPFLCCIPLLVPNQELIGTAFGIWKAFNSSGSTLLSVAAGAIQDLTPTGVNQYDRVFYFIIALKSIDVCYGCIYHWFDMKYLNGVLRASEKTRVRLTSTNSEEVHHRFGLRGPVKKITYFGLLVGLALITAAYVVYCVYAIGT